MKNAVKIIVHFLLYKQFQASYLCHVEITQFVEFSFT